MQSENPPQFEFLGEQSLVHLNYQRKILYAEFRDEFIQWLREEGKNPDKREGYSEDNVRPLARRVHQVFRFAWNNNDREALELSPQMADRFFDALVEDQFTKNDGDPYESNSKDKLINALETYFTYRDKEWEPEFKFSDNSQNPGSDPLKKEEREAILDAALEYKSPPNYSNLSPQGRDRWKAHLAQELGKPKEVVTPADFEQLRQTWKYGSLISTALDAGWRAAMVGRLRTSHVGDDNKQIHIPGDIAVKNNESWTVPLTESSRRILEKWLSQRENKPKYDDSEHIWLNRRGNPYTSATLNDLLSNLLDEAGIDTDGRTLTWHSIRHSTGMYVYEQKNDLALVAEILRHTSTASARRYAHPTPETKRSPIEAIQGGIA